MVHLVCQSLLGRCVRTHALNTHPWGVVVIVFCPWGGHGVWAGLLLPEGKNHALRVCACYGVELVVDASGIYLRMIFFAAVWTRILFVVARVGVALGVRRER